MLYQLLIIITGIANPFHVNGLNIRFYERMHQNGYFHEYTNPNGCINLPPLISPLNGSVWTDGCIIMFMGHACSNYSVKIISASVNIKGYRWEINEYREDGRPYNTDWDTWTGFSVKSFIPCEPDGLGGDRVHIDILQNATVVQSFPNLCGCQNLPSAVINAKDIFYNNHGNGFTAYAGENCTGNYVVYPAGVIPLATPIKKVRGRVYCTFIGAQAEETVTYIERDFYKGLKNHFSIGPLKSLKVTRHCVNMSASVYKFKFLPAETTDMGLDGSKKYSSKTHFWNNGSATISMTYETVETVRESVEVEVAQELRDMHKVGVDVDMEVETEAGVPFITSAAFKKGLKRSYKYTRKSSSSQRVSRTVAEEKDVKVELEVQVPPCTHYTATSYVAFAKNKLIRYKAYSKVTGFYGKLKMNVDEIRSHLNPGLEIVGDWDQFTVMVSAVGTMKVEHDIKSGIHGEGEKIPGCEEF